MAYDFCRRVNDKISKLKKVSQSVSFECWMCVNRSVFAIASNRKNWNGKFIIALPKFQRLILICTEIEVTLKFMKHRHQFDIARAKKKKNKRQIRRVKDKRHIVLHISTRSHQHYYIINALSMFAAFFFDIIRYFCSLFLFVWCVIARSSEHTVRIKWIFRCDDSLSVHLWRKKYIIQYISDAAEWSVLHVMGRQVYVCTNEAVHPSNHPFIERIKKKVKTKNKHKKW